MARCFYKIYGIIKAYADIQGSLGNDRYYEFFTCDIYNTTHASQWSIDTELSMF